MEKFKVVVWCDLCRGDDEEGCFGGSEEVIGEAFESWDASLLRLRDRREAFSVGCSY